MDVRYINPFIASVKTVFKTMLSADLMLSKPVVRDKHDGSADVSAIIGLSGDAVGCVALCFPMQSATKIASTFAGVELDQNHEDFSDALGELANMVAGQAKAQMDGLSISISLPSVIIGKEHVISQSKLSPRLAIPCDSTLGRFAVEVAMRVEKQQPKPAPQPAMAAAAK